MTASTSKAIMTNTSQFHKFGLSFLAVVFLSDHQGDNNSCYHNNGNYDGNHVIDPPHRLVSTIGICRLLRLKEKSIAHSFGGIGSRWDCSCGFGNTRFLLTWKWVVDRDSKVGAGRAIACINKYELVSIPWNIAGIQGNI